MVISEAGGKNTFPRGLFLRVRCADLLLWEYLHTRMRRTKSGTYLEGANYLCHQVGSTALRRKSGRLPCFMFSFL